MILFIEKSNSAGENECSLWVAFGPESGRGDGGTGLALLPTTVSILMLTHQSGGRQKSEIKKKKSTCTGFINKKYW